jgi:hypothetical protein
VKPVGEMSRAELAAFVASHLRERGIDVVLSGGSCVAIYSREQYVSMDLDLVNVRFARRRAIRESMEEIGFKEEVRYFRHPDSALLVEFPPGPLGVGEEPVKQIDELHLATGKLRIISPTDCVKDRLAWYFHDNDNECLEQAVLVARVNAIDLKEVARWASVEGKRSLFDTIKPRLGKDGSRT